MKIGDRVFISESKHPLYGLEGSLVGFRGKRPPDDEWLLVYVDMRSRSFLIPKSMVKLIEDNNKNKKDNKPGYPFIQ